MFRLKIIYMSIELLTHHVRPQYPTLEFGVFDWWKWLDLEPTLEAIQQKVIPDLKKALDVTGKPLYPFLTKNLQQRNMFEKRWLECYRAFLEGNYVEIPDYDLNSLKHNKDHLCAVCPNWLDKCQFETLDRSREYFASLFRKRFKE